MKSIRPFRAPHHSGIDERFHQLDIGNIGTVMSWRMFFEMAQGLSGDVVECGVGRARSLAIIAAINHLLLPEEGGGRRIFGYDSFRGFPEPTIEDASPRQPRKGDWARSPTGHYEYTAAFAREVLREAGVPDDAVTLTPGFFNETLPHHPDRPIVILHIDADLYSSYRDALACLYPKVVSGGFVIFDDFLSEPDPQEKFPGARRAVKEFFKDDVRNLRPSPSGGCYIVKP
jgi:O-methyltransferase